MKLRLLSMTLFAAALASAETFFGNGGRRDVQGQGPGESHALLRSGLRQERIRVGAGRREVLKFDESGNARTLSLLKKSTKDKDLKMKVTGTLDGDVIKVQAVELLP